MNGTIDRGAPTQRPAGRPRGYQRWSDLLFIHWRLPPDEIQPLVPAGLTVDTFDGSAWVGLIPFYMSGVRPRWLPPVPGVSAFHETNVRTYVHLDGREPGVWFLSMEASSSLAVRVARRLWHLPYYRADMEVARSGNLVRYCSRRRWPGPAGAGYSIEGEIGEAINSPRPDEPAVRVPPGSLEFFLIERYVLYSQSPGGTLYRGRVHHGAYPLRKARLPAMNESLLDACGIAPRAGPEHVVFSNGVDVEIFGLERVT